MRVTRAEPPTSALQTTRLRILTRAGVVEVYFDGNEIDAAAFVIAVDTAFPCERGLDVVAVASPLDKALIGARVGESRSYKFFSGTTVRVPLVSSRPCDGYAYTTPTDS
ncbi:hypothetical protein ABQF35_10460 [Mycobacterium syngnathidarum]